MKSADFDIVDSAFDPILLADGYELGTSGSTLVTPHQSFILGWLIARAGPPVPLSRNVSNVVKDAKVRATAQSGWPSRSDGHNRSCAICSSPANGLSPCSVAGGQQSPRP